MTRTATTAGTPRVHHHVQLPKGAPSGAFTLSVPGVSVTEFRADDDGRVITDEAGARMLKAEWSRAVVTAPGGGELVTDPHTSDATGGGDTAGGDAGTSA